MSTLERLAGGPASRSSGGGPAILAGMNTYAPAADRRSRTLSERMAAHQRARCPRVLLHHPVIVCTACGRVGPRTFPPRDMTGLAY